MHSHRTPDVALWDPYRAKAASEEIKREFERAGLADLCRLAGVGPLRG